MSTVIPFPARRSAPVTVLPTPAVRAGMERARDADRAQGYIGRAARAAADIMAGGPEKRARAHPDLHRSFAAKVETLAQLARSLASEGESIGHYLPRTTLNSLAGICEDVAAEIIAEIAP